MLDTDVVIAALDQSDAHHRNAAEAFARFVEEETDLLISAVNYAESLVRPAEDERNLRAAIDAISSLRIRVAAPDAVVARDAARFRALGISLADGFALATAKAHGASVASFDKRVRRALRTASLRLCKPLASE
ncbi:MAG TPA: PIN domain-containing protein [Solirubrobacterales bacterium]|nr:PIN domain-containing protein [Solirubrobacterales bacterium]